MNKDAPQQPYFTFSKSSLSILAAGVVSFVLILIFCNITLYFDNKGQDLMFKFRSTFFDDPKISSDIVVVTIDDYSLAQSNKTIWQYEDYAKLLFDIAETNPSVIGLDVYFTGEMDTTGWSMLIEAMEVSGNVINPYVVDFGEVDKLIDIDKRELILESLDLDDPPLVEDFSILHAVDIPFDQSMEVLDASAGLGYINKSLDSDGVFRKLPIVAEVNRRLGSHLIHKMVCDYIICDYDSIAIRNNVMTMHGPEDTLYIPIDNDGNYIVNFTSWDNLGKHFASQDASNISAWDLVSSDVLPDLSDKIVLVGNTSTVAQDQSLSPYGTQIPNLYTYAIAMSNVLNNNHVKSLSFLYLILVLLILMRGLAYMSIKLRPMLFIVMGILYIVACFFILLVVFVKLGYSLPIFSLLFPITISFIVGSIVMIYDSQVELAMLEGSLQSYLSPALMDKLRDNPDFLKAGGARKRITVLMSDVAGFTKFCDKADPGEVQDLLDEYLSEMSKIIFKYDGIVDKFLGDGILAFFENEGDEVNSPRRAVDCSIEMQKKCTELAKKHKKQKRFPVEIYVSLATGYAKVGNIGPSEKTDYTIIGSVVNLCSRLNDIAEKGEIVLDEDTSFFIKDDYKIEKSGKAKVKGLSKAVSVSKLSY
ncbi:MAG: hypothetical protein CBD58_04555 [bacterium TMED198]|nr:MAG: hypothetical protein CBD58_04555 [bacterium TMED198]|tara:strand:+ start:4011 stop:5948 length:1938 start_codon:yes stop_codon:yes gene_type:complete